MFFSKKMQLKNNESFNFGITIINEINETIIEF
jgi:hypothetical protein